MPTVPNFQVGSAGDSERVAWLRKWFQNKGEFDATIDEWDVTTQRCDSAVTYAGYVAATLVTVISGVQSVLTSSSANAAAINILSYVQTGLGLAVIAIGAVCKIRKETHAAPRDKARKEFTQKFFAANGTTPNDIWQASPQPPALASDAARYCCL